MKIPPLLRRSKPTKIAAAMAMLLFAPGSTAENLDIGIRAYTEERFTKALAIFQKYAAKGDPTAQHYLSVMYHSGLGIEADESEAFYWCKQAADEGLLDAQYQLGIYYLQGVGVQENDALALDWLWQAADRGHAQAKEVLQFALENDFTTGC